MIITADGQIQVLNSLSILFCITYNTLKIHPSLSLHRVYSFKAVFPGIKKLRLCGMSPSTVMAVLFLFICHFQLHSGSYALLQHSRV